MSLELIIAELGGILLGLLGGVLAIAQIVSLLEQVSVFLG